MPSDFGKDNYPNDYDPKQEEKRNKTWERIVIVMISLAIVTTIITLIAQAIGG